MRLKETGDFVSDDIESYNLVDKIANEELLSCFTTSRENSKKCRQCRKTWRQDNNGQLKGFPTDIVVVQVYMPTTEYSDEEIDAVYEELRKIVDGVKGTE